MKIPFTVTEFLSVFEAYNKAIWPLQIIAYLMGFAVIYLILKGEKRSGRIVSGIMSFMWLWTGISYHISYFSSINKAAYIFGALFMVQGILFLITGVLKPNIKFQIRLNRYSFVGFAFILYAMLIYPILGYMQGHIYPQNPVFGVAPCPVTIFTFGLLLLTENLPKKIIIIPLIWSIVGFTASFTLGIREDIGLLIAGLVGSSMLIFQERLSRIVQASREVLQHK